MILIEEAWKAIASANMADYIKYLYKTVRKYFGEAIVVTQEVDDIIQSPIVKESIINNSDCKILLDQRKYMTKFDGIQAMLGLSEKEKSQILSINQNNDPHRLYKEVWIGLGGMQSAVYATEVSLEEYLTYTTEETEKVEVLRLAEQLGGDIEAAIRQLAREKTTRGINEPPKKRTEISHLFQNMGGFRRKSDVFFLKNSLVFIAFSQHLTRILIISNQPTNEKVHSLSFIAFHSRLWKGSCPMGGD